jgi:Uma2 family endonuclease
VGNPAVASTVTRRCRIHYFNHTRFHYPDALVVRDENRDEDQWQDRPVLIMEVLSESTRRTDLAEKRDAYLTIPSLRVLLFAEPDRPQLIVHRREADGGIFREDYAGLEF